MKKLSLIVLASLFSGILLAQTIEISEAELKAQLDSVLVEAHLLYKYEKAAWISTDLAMGDQAIKNDFAGYLTYEKQGKIKVIILGKQSQNCIAEYSFGNDFNKPESAKTKSRKTSNKEKKLIDIRTKIWSGIIDNKYAVALPPDGFALNAILIPVAKKYKFYIITGATLRNVIPYGNDYLFIVDKNGEIENWQKFHSRLIPAETEVNGHKVNVAHSHLKTTPLITATDICTFMLYAPLYDLDILSVFSPAIKKNMKYSLKEDKITVE